MSSCDWLIINLINMNEFFKKWLDKQPLLSVNPLHNGQYYLTDEQAIDFAKYYHAEQLILHGVSCSSDGCYECGSNDLKPKEYKCNDCGHEGYCY